MSLTPGSRVGPYEILSSIGAGGMGEVYKARDAKLDRDVAIKVLPASFAEDADRVARFEREARTLAALNHPHIAQIFGLESPSAGSPQTALVMEFVDGDDLSTRIARGAMPLDEVLPIAKQIADALEAAHDQGIIHRDLKPANVKVRADGTVKVLDFGLAKMADPSGSSSAEMMNSPTLTARGTQMGMIIGTAAYMSPEQAKGRVVDKRADIWAFGVVLFEMLTGKRGYDAEDISDTLAAVLTREVDYSQLPAATPPRLSALLRDCLVRDPKQRLRDMGEARRVLDQLIAGNSGSTIMPTAGISGIAPPLPESPAWRRHLPWAIAGLALIVAAAATWTTFSTPPPSARVVTRGRSSTKELSAFMSLSRDGAQLVHMVSVGQQGFSLLLRQMDQFEGKMLTGTTGGVFPIFSPGADWVAFSILENKIKKVPVAGGTSITLCEGNFQDGAAWSDDDWIVFSGAKGLMRVPANGGTPEALTSLDTAKSETRHTRPQFLLGGRQLLFTVTTADGPQFAVLDLQKRTYQIIGKGGDNGRYVPTGHLTFVRNGTLFATPFDLTTLTATGSETPVIEGVSAVGTPGTGDYTVSDTGVLVYAESLAQNGTLLTWMDRKGAVSPLPGQVHRAWGTGTLSPDGRRVANAITADKGEDIWVVELSRGTPQRLTFGGENDNPIWAPNGRDLVYAGNPNGKPGLYTVPADGSGQPELVIAGDAMVPSSFTPDGKTLLYSQLVSGNQRVFVLPPPGSDGKRTPRLLRDGAGSDFEARISPDGKWVLLVSSESGRAEVYVLPFPGPGPKTQISTEGGLRVRWAASGRELFYWTGAAGNSTLMSVATQPAPTFSAGPPVGLFSTFSGTTWGVAPDAQHFLIETVGDTNGGTTIATVTNWFDELRKRAPVKK